MPSAKEILSWREHLKRRRVNFDFTAEEIVRNGMSAKKMPQTDNYPGSRQNLEIFDGTMQDAIPFAASFIHSNTMNQATSWFLLKHRDPELNAMPDVQTKLQDDGRRMLLAMMQSNYYTSSLEWVQDWLAFGTGAKLIEEVPSGARGVAVLMSTALPFGTYVIAEGKDNKIDTSIRDLSVTGKELVEKFGLEALSPQTQERVRKNPFEDIKVVHAIYPRSLAETLLKGRRKVKGSSELAWASVWIEEEQPRIIGQGGYHVFPVSVTRYNVIAGEVYGRGIGELMLPNAKTLNIAIRKAINEWDKTLDPPTLEKVNSIIGDLSHRPGSRNYTLGNPADLRFLNDGMRHGNRLHELNAQDLRSQIERTAQIQAIRDLIGKQSPNPEKSATEVLEIIKIIRQLLGPSGGRLESEGLQDDIAIIYDIMERKNALAPAPEVLRARKGEPLDVVFEGALAKAQREEEAQQILRYIQEIGAGAALDPSIGRLPNLESFYRKLAELRGVQEHLNSKQDFNQIKQLMAQVAEMQAQMQAMEQMATSAGKAAPALQALNGGQGQRAA